MCWVRSTASSSPAGSSRVASAGTEVSLRRCPTTSAVPSLCQGDLPSIDLPGGATVVLLSPTGPKLKTMATTWETDVKKAHLVPGAGDAGHSTSPKPRDREFDPLPDPLDAAAIATLAAEKDTDGSKANGSSIAFVLEHDGKRVLFGADAHAPVLTKALKRYGERVGEVRPRIDLVKLSHHGSNANISTAMLEQIDCRRYLISTNGDNFAHPDDAAIAKVIKTFAETSRSSATTVRHAPIRGASTVRLSAPRSSSRRPASIASASLPRGRLWVTPWRRALGRSTAEHRQ
jgi:hypothetical protein